MSEVNDSRIIIHYVFTIKRYSRTIKPPQFAFIFLFLSWQKKGKASGYILFAAEFRKEIMNENQHLGFGEISKLVGSRVGSISLFRAIDFH